MLQKINGRWYRVHILPNGKKLTERVIHPKYKIESKKLLKEKN